MPSSASFASLGLTVAHVNIGDCVFATRPMLLTTVLGSCVCATFHHAQLQAGGMFHAMLPDVSMARPDSRPCIFADQAVASMVARFRAQGMDLAELEVKLFGGANTMISRQPQPLRDVLDVGRKNVASALAALLTYQDVVAEVQHLQPLEHAKLDGEGVAQQVAPAVPRQHQAEQVAIAVTVVGGLA